MPDGIVLWGPSCVPSGPGDPGYERDVRLWVDRCASVGVTRMITGQADPVLTAAAHEKGIAAHPYRDFTAFPNYGRRRVSYGWSLDWVRPPIESPEARRILERHRPVWDGPTVEEESVEPFALEHPEMWSLTRDGRRPLQPGERRYMSLAFAEVRANQTARFLDSLENADGADGIQIEFVLGDEDEDGCSPYGYEDAVAVPFREQTGRDPFDIPNDDPEWLRFRAGYVTRFLEELKDAIAAAYPGVAFTSTMIAGDPDDYLKVLQDWPAWLDAGAVDELYVWWRTDSDLGRLERQARHAADVVAGRVPLVAELSCYHPGSFQDPDLLVEGARVALANGADAVGVYRTHGVDQLDLWSALERMANL